MARILEPVPLVVDASVVAKYHLEDEEFSDEATDILRRFGEGELDLLAPEQIRYEVPSAITAATRQREPRLSEAEGRGAIEEFLGLGIRVFSPDGMILDAYQMVHRYAIAFYDALYLALATSLGISFITADRRLYTRIAHLPQVFWIGDYRRPNA